MFRRFIKLHSLLAISIGVFFSSVSNGEVVDATVTTHSGTYQVLVEVEEGEVTYIIWPNGGETLKFA